MTFLRNVRYLRRLPGKVRARFQDWRAPRYSSEVKFHVWPWSSADLEHFQMSSVESDQADPLALETELRRSLNLPDKMDIVSVGSGRSALQLGLSALKKLKPERSKVVLPTYCCGSVYEAVALAGLEPVFVDTTETLNSSPADYLRTLDSETLAVIIVNLFGRWMNEEDRRHIFETCRQNEVFVVEDNAQCFCPYREEYASARDRADMEVHSFGFGKFGMATAGGALIFRQATQEVRGALKNYRPGSADLAMQRFYYFEHRFGAVGASGADLATLSTTSEQYGAERISELDAALVRESLRNCEKILRRSVEIGRRYAEVVKRFPSVYRFRDSERNVFFRFPIILRDIETTNAFWAHMRAYKIELEGMYIPLHIRHSQNGQFPRAEELYRCVFNIPNRISLPPSEIDRIADALVDFGKRWER